jgi:hypothetical protein
VAGVLFLVMIFGPLAFVPAGLVVLVRSRGPFRFVAGPALLVLGAGCAFGDWLYARCDEVPDPCGPPDWVATAVVVAMLCALAALATCALAALVSRASRSRSAP